MSYTSLYRKFRPVKFEEIVGQDHIIKTLKNQIVANRVGHAYLLNGGRGTGKTSAAKILARAVNCLNPKDGEPCNECEICKAAIQGSLTDIVEMDAASNNSVEDVRAIRDEVNFLPTLAKYRIYIIDEVHMLSTGAFNALLKTLEEPPEHVKFILATTEPQKLPATILSRCQRFDFKKISVDDIIKRLEIVSDSEKVKITPEAMKTIAVLADGAMRDAWSILERCIQEGNNEIDDELVKELAGIPKTEYIFNVVNSISECNVMQSLQDVDNIIKDGKDLTNLVWEIIKYVKDVLVYKTTGKAELYNEKEVSQIKQIADKCSSERLLNIIYNLSEIENNIKWSSQKSIMFQIGIMKLCNNEVQSAQLKTAQPEVQNVQLKTTQPKVQSVQPRTIQPEVQSVKPKTAQLEAQNVQPKVAQPDVQKVQSSAKGIDCWPEVMGEIKQSGKIMLYTNLMPGKAVELNDMTVGIEFPNGLTAFGKSIFEKQENINEISRLISLKYGKPMGVKIIDAVGESKSVTNPIDNLANEFGMPINIMDD